MTTTPPAPNATSRRAILIVAAALLVLALTAGGLFAGRTLAGDAPAERKRPVAPVRAAFTKLAFTDEVNDAAAFASIELRNTGAREAVIESVTPEGVPLGLDVLDIQAADTRELDEPIGATDADWLPDLRAAAGATLPPRAASSVQLVFVVSGTRPGRFAFGRTTVRYRVGDVPHTLRVPAGATLVATTAE